MAAKLGPWVSLLAAVVRNNPGGDIYGLLSRQDLVRQLDADLLAARAVVEEELRRAWPPESSAYRDRLMSDIDRVYAEAAMLLREAAVRAFQSVPPEYFIPGVHEPGRNPAMEAAVRRAAAVRTAVSVTASYLGFRNEMTAAVARTRRAGEHVLAEEPGPGWLKKWVCRKDADGRPDSRVCLWCRALDAMPAIPLPEEFSYGDLIGGHRPPRVYLDLLSPPRHPRCRCRIILVRAGTAGASEVRSPAAATPASFIPASLIRGLPEERYQALREFHQAAIHELGQVLRRHREVGRA